MESENQTKALQVFSSDENFALAQRIGKALIESSLVPKEYQKNLPNTLIALEMASRIGASPLMVMQHLNIIYGRPSWSSTFIIAAINTCGRFEPLQYKLEGEGMKRTCMAFTKDKKGVLLEGPVVSMEMAKAEGWFDKNGSKWKTMPELMLRYRAAAFFGRLYAPEVTMGMQSVEEVADAMINLDTVNRGQRFDEEEIQVAEDVTNAVMEIPVEPAVQQEQKAEKFEKEEIAEPKPDLEKPIKAEKLDDMRQKAVMANTADSLFPEKPTKHTI